MKEPTKYKAICCDTPMYDMGIWPVTVDMLDWSKWDESGQKIVHELGEGTCYANRYHCKVCNRFIGIAWHQAPTTTLELSLTT